MKHPDPDEVRRSLGEAREVAPKAITGDERPEELLRSAFPAFVLGAQGTCSGTATIIPEHMIKLFALVDEGKIQEATACFQESLSIGRELGYKMEITYALNYLGAIYANQGDYAHAIRNGEEALNYAREMGFVKEMEESGKVLYEAYKKTGRYKEALTMHELYAQMHDSLLNEENTRAITIQQMNYKYEKKEQAELLARSKQEHLDALKHQREDQITYGAIGLIILLSFLSSDRTKG